MARWNRKTGRVALPSRSAATGKLNRPLRFEPLEDRRLLAGLVVNTHLDVVATDGVVSLREAIAAANGNSATELGHVGSGADTITFEPVLSGQTILLNDTELEISESLTIDGTALNTRVWIIPAETDYGVINITSSAGSYHLSGLMLYGSVVASGRYPVE